MLFIKEYYLYIKSNRISSKYHDVSLLLLWQVVDKMQSGGTSSKNNRRAELPTIGLGEEVIKDLETLKAKDVDWQGKCSGTVYVHLILADNKLKLVQHRKFQFINYQPLFCSLFFTLI